MGTVAPLPGYNAALRRITAEHGALLIFDEVMTGFRVSRSGWYGVDPVDADLFTFGKVMSGGLPAAAFGGRAEVMERLAPLGPVYQAGTLSGNPVAMAAGLATLRAADDAAYAALDANADRLAGLLVAALTEAGVAHQVQRAGNMLSVFFTDEPVTDFASARASRDVALPAVLPRPARRRRVPAAERVRNLVRLSRFGRRRLRPHRRRPARRRPRRRGSDEAGMTEKTIVHVMRHGEVHNPDKILYGRLPDYHLSDRGRAQAQAVADWLARPRHRLRGRLAAGARAGDRGTDRGAPAACPSTPTTTCIESLNIFQGQRVSPGDGALRDPRNWWHLRNPRTPSWGEPYAEIADADDGRAAPGPDQGGRPRGGVRQPSAARRDAAAGDDGQAACITSRTRRLCNLASLTSFYFHGDTYVGWGYAELAGQ